MKRLFIAIKIDPDNAFLEQLRQLKIHFRHEKIKWVEDHNIHVTLKFLGDTEEERIPEIVGAIKQVAEQHPVFTIQLQKLGVFGSRYDPRVIWAGIEPYTELVSLMQRVHSSLVPAGFEPDRQNLIPHLTLGRIKELKDKVVFQRTMDQFRNISSAKMVVTNFILYESILKKEGPVYTEIDQFGLLPS
jgi:RNA 2',3'-cyclic 3'-phosphodiesterase